MDTGRGSTSEATSAERFDDTLTVLSDPERRNVLRVLRDVDGSVSVQQLAAALADRRDDAVDTSALRVRLIHNHLPALETADLVTVDDAGDEVALGSLTPAAMTILDIDPAERPDGVVDQTSNVPPDTGAEVQSPVEKLAEQKRMFSTLIANLPGLAYRCENERGWPMSFVSEGCRDLTGYDPSAIENGRVSWGEDIIHPDDRDHVWDTVQSAVGNRDPFEVTYRIHDADGAVRHVWEQGRAVYSNGEVEALEGFITDTTDQRERQRRLEAIFDGSFQFMGLLEPDGTLLEANEPALEFGGLDREDVVGEFVWETPWWQRDEATAREVREAVETAAAGEFVRYRVTVAGTDREATIDFSLRPVTDERGEVTLLVAEGRDITERVRHERQLEALNDVAHCLVDAGEPEAVCAVAVEAAQETLGLELATIELFDEERGDLVPVARTDAVADLVGDDPLVDAERRKAWEVFVDQEQTVYADLADADDLSTSETPLDSAIVLPLGTHGVFVAGATEPEAFDDTDLTLARILATHTEVSLDSVVREAELRERSEAIAEQNARLSQLNDLNEVIRDLLQSLLGASRREEILRTACESLTGVGSYRFAWVGSLDPVSGEITPEAHAGVAEGFLDAVTVPTGTDADIDPAGRAAQRGEVVVVDQIRSDPPFGPWRKAALERDYHAAIAIPLTYDDAHHGVLTVYADEPDTFDDLERAVLTELGEAISYAITATQRKQALVADQVVELEFGLREPDTPLLRCVEAAGGAFDFEGTFQEGEGSLTVFFTLSGGDADALAAAAADEPDVADLRTIADHDDETLYECVLTDAGVFSTVFAHGGVPRDLTAEDGEVTLVVELPVSRDVREFTETIEKRFPTASLLARRQRDRPLRTAADFRQQLRERLTERNLEVIKQAYYSGFFEWPRENSGEEVATALDISQPTFNRHLRNAQQTLFELLVEADDQRD
jgi:PAS domain S-box-containing protein